MVDALPSLFLGYTNRSYVVSNLHALQVVVFYAVGQTI